MDLQLLDLWDKNITDARDNKVNDKPFPKGYAVYSDQLLLMGACNADRVRLSDMMQTLHALDIHEEANYR